MRTATATRRLPPTTGAWAFASSATTLSGPWPDNGIDHVYEWSSKTFSTVKLSVNDVLDEQANANSYQPAISANGLVVAFVSTAPNVTAAAARGVPNVLAHKWRDRLCLAVLVSMAVHSRKQEPPPDPDDDRCEDRSTEPLLRRAEEIHKLLDEIAQGQRTTAAVRAKDHTGACVLVLAGGAARDLDGNQLEALRPGEIAARLPGADAEITALAEILWKQDWKPLALGIAPEQRASCNICRAFIESHPHRTAATSPPQDGGVAVTRNWWEPPSGVGDLAPEERVAFALVCAEHVLPSFRLQAGAYPRSASTGPSPEALRECLDLLWAWPGRGELTPPHCATDEALYAQIEVVEGLAFLVEDAYALVAYGARAATHPEACVHAGRRALSAADELVTQLLGPRPRSRDPDTDGQLEAQRKEEVAAHELVRAERVAQAEAYEALARGAVLTDLRGPAQRMGQVMATWTARLLEDVRQLPHPGFRWLFPRWLD